MLTFGLTQLPSINARPQLLRWIHLSGWGLALLQLLAFRVARLSLRGQWADALPFVAAWLAASIYFLLRRQLGWAGKLYFGGWFVYPAALAGAYLLDRVFFALVSVPVFALLAQPVEYSDARCAIRRSGGLLSAIQRELITPVGPLEQHQGYAPGVNQAYTRRAPAGH
ncbi:hypothetical protein LJ737_07270 [Hymenobacter sp. 15J16-1T3B]|uniref:hypothetical protein n=1 Tax=Hymenobacter sp. 15J16-1T3B TaxID=2886941 RepID=UPI001D11BAB4|nr:hypothetical protein [Hymenobacter sp. 15J16-1T3B]MCC3157032.1 hypothetical protein [Hymenobacter sp. 15J16-1T3B]